MSNSFENREEGRARRILDTIAGTETAIAEDKRVVTPAFRSLATEIYVAAQLERRDQGLPIYSPEERVILLHELADTARIHRGRLRLSGNPEFDEHLAKAILFLIQLAGFTELPVVIAEGKHDTVEDTKTTKRTVFRPEEYEGQLEPYARKNPFLTKQIAGFKRIIPDLVDAVTKIDELEDKKERDRETFRKWLRFCLQYGFLPIVIKLCDRLSNMKTLSSQKPEKIPGIVQETEEIYIPAARMLYVRALLAELVDSCLTFNGNLKLLEAFLELEQDQQARLFEPFRERIHEVFNHTDNGNLHGTIEIRPRRLAEYLPFERSLLALTDLTLDDLAVLTTDPLCEVVITTDKPSGIPAALDLLLRRLATAKSAHMQDHGSVTAPLNLGRIVMLRDPKYTKGEIPVRITTKQNEANCKRGLLQHERGDGLWRLTAYHRERIEEVLHRTEPDESRHLVIPMAQEKLLRPPIHIITSDGKELPIAPGSTFLDAARYISAAHLLGCQKIYAYRQTPRGTLDEMANPLRIGKRVEVSLSQVPQNRDRIYVKSCLERGHLEPDKVEVTPGWLYLVDTEKTRELIRTYLAAPVTTLKRIIQGLLDNPKVQGEERENARAAYAALEEKNDRDEILKISATYLQDVAELFGFRDLERLIHFIRTQNSSLKENDLLLKIGTGEFDLIEFFAHYWKNRKQWHLKCVLPHVPKALHVFQEELGVQGIQIEDIHFVRTKQERRRAPLEIYGKKRTGTLYVSDPSGKHGAKGILTILLRYIYQGYQIRIQ